MQNIQIQDAEERTDQKFDDLDYSKALKQYQKFYKKAETNEDKMHYAIKVAECFQKLNRPKKSVEVFNQIDSLGAEIKGESAELYADALYNTGNYKEAKKWYNVAYKEPNSEHLSRIYQKRKNLSETSKLLNGNSVFEIKEASFNSEKDDFSPIAYKNGIVFVSNRNKGQTGGKKYAWDGGHFLDLFYADSVGNVSNFSKKINTSYHEGSATISPDGNTIVFTRSTAKEQSEEDVSLLKLFISKKDENDKWSKPIEFIWNLEEFSTGHPAFSPNGDRLYYASDRPNGIGGTDLYYSDLKDGNWSSPTLLGKHINSINDEVFPYISTDNKLYFSSDGWGGLGGLDIFVQDLENPAAKPTNMRAPINSSYDDLGGTITNNYQYFISSNRDNSSSEIQNDNILELVRIKFKGIVIDKLTRETIDNADIIIDNKIVTKSDDNGFFHVKYTDWNNQQTIYSQKVTYQGDSILGDSIRKKIANTELVVLELARPYIEGIVYDSVTKEPLIGRLTIKERSTKKEFSLFTDSTGYYKFPVLSNEHYDFIAERPKYFTQRRASNTEMNAVTKKNIALNPIIGQRIRIYYDFDKSNIRDDASHSLDTVVNVMRFNPTITIELSSHTDKRGRDSYNQLLSENRAKEAFDYAVKNGIEADRMTYKGYGETLPVVNCKNCTKEEHQLNRRTEFYVTGYLNEKGYFGKDFNKFYPDSLQEVLVDDDKELMRSNSNTITGIIEDKDNNISGISIKIKDDKGVKLSSQEIDNEGVFNIKVPNKYKYKIEVIRDGKLIKTKSISIEEFDGKNSFDTSIFL
ncbi:OmpA family protein [Flammeovirga kamogawensis]|uniref:PD40 domain-containing protein n=1 Tax=Flammeovirga kamogawensis TaxID=373891 RepID=A0ABX8GXP9_9BACT|nr:OmpA family protein [Flammeovirga kamogawensis]MBB6463915.1 outer membrane protein OmpA-like peptidoglycan-associated protein [Flammeovirga kamogawensis]QWG08321.1 PD40 domain-containing protein [Flammeovirga kamogawensis]